MDPFSSSPLSRGSSGQSIPSAEEIMDQIDEHLAQAMPKKT